MNEKKLAILRILKQVLFLALLFFAVKIVHGYLMQALFLFICFFLWMALNNLISFAVSRKAPPFFENARAKAAEWKISYKAAILRLLGGYALISAVCSLFLALVF